MYICPWVVHGECPHCRRLIEQSSAARTFPMYQPKERFIYYIHHTFQNFSQDAIFANILTEVEFVKIVSSAITGSNQVNTTGSSPTVLP